jgi:hypothetical protein
MAVERTMNETPERKEPDFLLTALSEVISSTHDINPALHGQWRERWTRPPSGKSENPSSMVS